MVRILYAEGFLEIRWVRSEWVAMIDWLKKKRIPQAGDAGYLLLY